MGRLFKAIVAVLIVATFIQALALAYVLGFEHGVNSQQPIIRQLYRELYPDLLFDFFIWLHPLRSTLFGTSMILAVCWAFVLLSIMQRRLSKPKHPIRVCVCHRMLFHKSNNLSGLTISCILRR